MEDGERQDAAEQSPDEDRQEDEHEEGVRAGESSDSSEEEKQEDLDHNGSLDENQMHKFLAEVHDTTPRISDLKVNCARV